MGLIKTPQELGFPPNIEAWRDVQVDGIERGLKSKSRFQGFVAPTGSGKTAMYLAQALLDGGRWVILTSTRGLQDQLGTDYPGLGIATIKGKANYSCPSGDHWTCADGFGGKCPFKATPACDYTRKFSEARNAQIVNTNYSYFISGNKWGQGLGKFDGVICDEAHHIYEELRRAMQVKLSFNEIQGMLHKDFPKRELADSMTAWKDWARRMLPLAELHLKEWKAKLEGQRNPPKSHIEKMHHFRHLARRLMTVSLCRPEEWVAEEFEYGYVLDCIVPGRYSESLLFVDTPRVLFTSATIRQKTLSMIGVGKENSEFIEYPMAFSPDNFRIYYVPTMRVDFRQSKDELMNWIMRQNQIIGRRGDRRGIIHSVAKWRRDFIIQQSRFRDIMMTNGVDDVTSDIVDKFKKSPPPRVLVSPSVTTGYDFPGDTAEYQIITKVPFPDSRSKLAAAQQEKDKEHAAHTAMQAIVQACGRINRSKEDRSETFIIDDHFVWFISRYGYLAPQWFHKFLRTANTLPEPLSKHGRN